MFSNCPSSPLVWIITLYIQFYLTYMCITIILCDDTLFMIANTIFVGILTKIIMNLWEIFNLPLIMVHYYN